MSVRVCWQRIAKWAVENIPEGKFRLAAGASEGQVADLEAILGFSLPKDVRESYRLHNGTDETPFPFKDQEHLTLDHVGKAYEMQRGFVLDPRNEVPQYVEGPIKPVWWSLHRVKLTDDGGGNGLMIDMDPAEGGTVGQVIEHSRDDGPRCVHASSWGVLLKRIADDTEAGRYVYGKKDNMWGLADDGSVSVVGKPDPGPQSGVAIDYSISTQNAFAAHPEVEAQVRAWVDDPSPKVEGLRISFGISFEGGVVIRMEIDNNPGLPIQLVDIPKKSETIARALDRSQKALIAKQKKGRKK
jgi:cell wall assembly regulator SMI1